MRIDARLLLPLAVAVLSAGPAGAADAASSAQVFRDCPDCPEMVIVPAGQFVMGTADPAAASTPGESQITVMRIGKPFAMGRFEVTRGEFAAFIRSSGYEIGPGCRSWDDRLGRFSDDARRTWLEPGRPAAVDDRHPVNCVSWADAQAYARWLAQKTSQPYRLPSEAEWEYAARAGSTALRPWGDEAAEACAHANTYDLSARAQYRLGREHAPCRDGQPDVATVGLFEPNAFGLHDMIGNVWEWTEDCSTGSYVGRPTDARAWTWLGGCARRVRRGGSWISPPSLSRVAARDEGDAGERADAGGFRVVLELDDDAPRRVRR